VIVGVLLLLSAWFAFRSYQVYRLRKFAWDASEARRMGDWRALERITRQWSRADPQEAMPWLLAAEAAEQLGASQRVAEYLEQMPPEDSRTPGVLLELATIYFGPLNQPLAGESTCQRALQLDPQYGEAYRRLIFYYGITLQRTKMVEYAREAIRRGCEFPESYVYLLGANWLTFTNAYELNAKWLRSGSDDETFRVAQVVHSIGASTPTTTLVEEVEEVESNRLKTREHDKRLRTCFAEYPNNPELLVYFLKQNATQGDMTEVQELLARVPASAADDNRVWHYKGWLHQARGELEEAEAAYRKALALHPYAWRSQFELAAVLRKQQRLPAAERMIALSMEGKRLRETILQLPDVQSVPPQVLQQMRHYAEACGDTAVAERLSQRLAP
jgi:tetratricopeptide (TPR) repeat protein